MTKTKAKHQLYLLVMSGQGDTYVKLVDKETWEWIGDPFKPCPDAVLKGYQERNETDDKPNITTGSAVNDAALQVAPAMVDGEETMFYGVKECMDFCKEHDIDIVDEWEGYIY